MMVSPTWAPCININLKIKPTDPDFKNSDSWRLSSLANSTNNSAIGLGFKATNQRPALLVPRVVSTPLSQLVSTKNPNPTPEREKLYNEAVFSGNRLFSLTPSQTILLSRIIFSSYSFLCGGGGNTDDKMAPSYSIWLPVCLTHTC